MDKLTWIVKKLGIPFACFGLGILIGTYFIGKNATVEVSEYAAHSNLLSSSLDTTQLDDNEGKKESIITQTDNDYADAMAAASSNIEICDVNARFTTKWMDIVEEYYELLCDISSEKLKLAFEIEKEEWIKYSQMRIDLEKEYLLQIYRSGTIVPIMLSQFKYEIYREKAIELINTYSMLENVGID